MFTMGMEDDVEQLNRCFEKSGRKEMARLAREFFIQRMEHLAPSDIQEDLDGCKFIYPSAFLEWNYQEIYEEENVTVERMILTYKHLLLTMARYENQLVPLLRMEEDEDGECFLYDREFTRIMNYCDDQTSKLKNKFIQYLIPTQMRLNCEVFPLEIIAPETKCELSVAIQVFDKLPTTSEEILNPIMSEPFVLTKEEEVEEEIEAIIQPRLPTLDEENLRIEEARRIHDAEKIKAKPDKKKKKINRNIKPNPVKTDHNPYWDIRKAKFEGVVNALTPEQKKFFEEMDDTLVTQPTATRVEGEIFKFNISRNTIIDYFDFSIEEGDYGKLIPNKAPTRPLTLNDASKTLLYDNLEQNIYVREPNDSYITDVDCLLHVFAEQVLIKFNYMSGVKATISYIRKHKDELSEIAIFSVLLYFKTKKMSTLHHPLFKNLQRVAMKPITDDVRKLIDMRNQKVIKSSAALFPYQDFKMNERLRTVLVIDKYESLIENSARIAMRIKKLPVGIELSNIIARVQALSVHEATAGSDTEEITIDNPTMNEVFFDTDSVEEEDVGLSYTARVKAKIQGYKDKCKDSMLRPMSEIFEGFKNSLVSASQKMGESFMNGAVGVIMALLETVKDTFASIFQTIKDKLGSIVTALKKGLVAFGVYEENLGLDYNKIMYLMISMLLYRATDSLVVKSLSVAYILYTLGLWDKLKDVVVDLLSRWHVEEAEEEEIHVATAGIDFLSLASYSPFDVLTTILCALFFTTCGYSATLFDRKSIAKIFTEGLRNVHFAAAGLVAIPKIIELIPALLGKVSSFFREKVLGKTPTVDDKEKKILRAMKFIALTSALTTDEADAALRINKQVQDIILNMHNEWIWCNMFSFSPECNLLDTSFKIALRTAAKDFKQLFNLVCRMTRQAGFRPTTFHIQLFGKPGVGKTTIMNTMVSKLGSKYFPQIEPSLLTWPKNTASDYYDGYKNQRVVLWDDCWSINDAAKAVEVLQLVANVPMTVPMARIEEKGTFFDSDFLISSTNIAYPDFKDVLCMEALHRRRHVLVEVIPDPDCQDKSSGKYELGLAQKKYPKLVNPDGSLNEEYARTFPNLTFNILKPIECPMRGKKNVENSRFYSDKDELPIGLFKPLVNLTLEELMKRICNRYDGMRNEESGVVKHTHQAQRDLNLTTSLIDNILREGMSKGKRFPMFEEIDIGTLELPSVETYYTNPVIERAVSDLVANIETVIEVHAPPSSEIPKEPKAGISIDAPEFIPHTPTVGPSTEDIEYENPYLGLPNVLIPDTPENLIAYNELCEFYRKNSGKTPAEFYRTEMKIVGLRRPGESSEDVLVRCGGRSMDSTPSRVADVLFNDKLPIDFARSFELNVPETFRVPRMHSGRTSGDYPLQRYNTTFICNNPTTIQLKKKYPSIEALNVHLLAHINDEARVLDVKGIVGEPECHYYMNMEAKHPAAQASELLLKYTSIHETFTILSNMTYEDRKEVIFQAKLQFSAFIVNMAFIDRAKHQFKYVTCRLRDFVFNTWSFIMNNVITSIYLFLIAFVTISSIVAITSAFYELFMGKNSQTPMAINARKEKLLQEYYHLDKLHPTSRVHFKRADKAPIIHTDVYVNQVASERLSEMSAVVEKNLLQIIIDGKMRNGIAVDGQVILTAYHHLEKYIIEQIPMRLSYRFANNMPNYWDVDIYPENIYPIPNSDAVLLFSRQLPTFKKISHRFYTEQQLSDYIPSKVWLKYCDPRTSTIHTNAEIATGLRDRYDFRITPEDVESFRTLIYRADPVLGSSGGMIMAPTNYSDTSIMGIQSYKRGGDAFASVISQETLLDMLSKIKGNIVSEGPLLPDDAKTDGYITTCTTELFKEAVRFEAQIPDNKVLGCVGKTAFKKTIFFEEFPSVRQPAVLNAFDKRVEPNTHPMQHSMDKYGRHEMRPIPKQFLFKAQQDVAMHLAALLPREPRILTIEEAIEGLSGHASYNLKTSPGIPYVYNKKPGFPGKRSWIKLDDVTGKVIFVCPELRARIQFIQLSMLRGIIPPQTMYEFPKDELRPAEKVLKARSISVDDMAFSILGNMYMLDLFSMLHDLAKTGSIPFCVGIDPCSISWTKMFQRMCKHASRCSDADINNWDGHATPQLLLEGSVPVILQLYGFNEYSPEGTLIYGLVMKMLFSYVQILDLIIHTMRGVKSGWIKTAEINTLSHWILFLAFYYELTDRTEYYTYSHFMDKVVVYFYGDDLIFSMSPLLDFTALTIYQRYEYYGWPVSSADKVSEPGVFKGIYEVQFLKRRFKDDEIMGRALIHGAIEPPVINDLLSWMRTQPDLDNQLYVNVNEALEFAFAHGMNFYKDILCRINKVLKKFNLPFVILSYTDMRYVLLCRIFGTPIVAPDIIP